MAMFNLKYYSLEIYHVKSLKSVDFLHTELTFIYFSNSTTEEIDKEDVFYNMNQ